MNLSPEQIDQGRRNFLRIIASTPAVVALGAGMALRGPVPGGPVRVGFVGVGSRGRTLLGLVDPAYAQVRAFCDINPSSLQRLNVLGVPTMVRPYGTVLEATCVKFLRSNAAMM